MAEKQISRFVPQYSGDVDAWAKAMSTFLNTEVGSLFGKANDLLNKMTTAITDISAAQADIVAAQADIALLQTVPWLGHFHSTLVADDNITITGCPFRPRYAYLQSEGEHGSHSLAWDTVVQAIGMGHYGCGATPATTALGEGSLTYGSWQTIHDVNNWSFGWITSFTGDGFITHQHIAAAGFVARVQFILFP